MDNQLKLIKNFMCRLKDISYYLCLSAKTQIIKMSVKDLRNLISLKPYADFGFAYKFSFLYLLVCCKCLVQFSLSHDKVFLHF